MHLAIVGAGRLGRSLAALLVPRGHQVALCGRTDPVPDADVTLLTVPDRALAGAAAALPPRRGPVLHCSGASTVDVLRPHAPAGSFHPLMTFPGPDRLPDLTGVPAALAGDDPAIAAGRALADALGMRAIEVHGDRRLYHAAAVLAGNYSTVLLAVAARVAAAAGLDPDDAPGLLAPLAVQSLRNAAADPLAALTGPAARGDHAVIDGHRAALDRDDLALEGRVYDALTDATLSLLAVRSATSTQEHAAGAEPE